MIFRQKIVINWVTLKAVCQNQAIANNTKDNKKRLRHIYKVDNLVLIFKKPYELAEAGKISLPTYSKGPYKILKLYKNGTIKIQRESFTDILSIRHIMPALLHEKLTINNEVLQRFKGHGGVYATHISFNICKPSFLFI
jgi:hypothetical protein